MLENGRQQFLQSGDTPLPGRAVILCASFGIGGIVSWNRALGSDTDEAPSFV